MENVNKELRRMEKHLKGRPDGKLLKGYKAAMKDYDDTEKKWTEEV